jgi:GTP-binding protein
MADTNFIDYVKILCRSGKGGAGSRHFYRAKYVPKGGPDGGDGGRGGHIILRGNRHMWTLLPLKYRRHIFAGNGQSGSGGRSFGKDGEDVIIDVPCGTVVYEAETGTYLTEVTDDGQIVKLLKGGRGGLGNWHFKSATNRTPRYAQPGEPAIEKSVILELKMLADVGLVGFPNAGKSTLVSSVSAARPKIADYPFTTMEPQLGIVSYRDNRSFVMADIPGIIEGASEGKGLGLRFLRHIERNAVLLFMVPADADDITEQYNILLNELQQFNPQLMDKHRILAVSKSDMLDDELIEAIRETLPKDIPNVFISAVTGQGLTELKDTLWRAITDESNRLATPDIVHQALDSNHRVAEEDNFIFEYTPMANDEEEEEFEGEDLQSIDPSQWGEDFDGDEYDDYDDAPADSSDNDDDDDDDIDEFLYESEVNPD